MSGKNIAIIGGGISGLVSGIFAIKRGYKPTIYEKNVDVGGMLVRNDFKKDYLNDSFIYFYYNDELKDFYDFIGLDDIKEVENYFYLQYKDLYIYRDLNLLEKLLISKSIVDEKRIKSFIKIIKEAKNCDGFVEKPLDCMGILEQLKYASKMSVKSKLYKKYSSISVKEYFKDFKSKDIRNLFGLVVNEELSMYNLIIVLAKYCQGSLIRINLSSFDIIQRIKNKYLSLGGKIIVNTNVDSIDVNKGEVISISCEKDVFYVDYVISAIDVNYTLKTLLKDRYKEKKFDIKFNDYKNYKTNSLLSLNFYIKDINNNIPYVFSNDIQRTKIASSNIDKIMFINRGDYISCDIIQDSDDYLYWKLLSKSNSIYSKEIERIKELVKEVLKNTINDLYGIICKVKCLDCFTPLDYEKKFNAYKGALYSFAFTEKGNIFSHDGRLANLKNLYLASQWLSSPGGIYEACLNGYYSIVRLEYDNKKNK